MLCGICGKDSPTGVLVGVMVSTIGVKPRKQKYIGAIPMCEDCQKKPPMGRHNRDFVRSAIRRAVNQIWAGCMPEDQKDAIWPLTAIADTSDSTADTEVAR
jgi:hypothetical protein